MKITRNDIAIVSNLATFSVNHEGALAGSYIGQFVFKCFLLPYERLSASKEKRDLLGEFGVAATAYEQNLALALSELKYRIVQAPPFWTQNNMLGNIADSDLIFKVYEAAMDSQEMYLEQKEENKKKMLEILQKQADAILEKQRKENARPKTEEEKLEEELDELDK